MVLFQEIHRGAPLPFWASQKFSFFEKSGVCSDIGCSRYQQWAIWTEDCETIPRRTWPKAGRSQTKKRGFTKALWWKRRRPKKKRKKMIATAREKARLEKEAEEGGPSYQAEMF